MPSGCLIKKLVLASAVAIAAAANTVNAAVMDDASQTSFVSPLANPATTDRLIVKYKNNAPQNFLSSLSTSSMASVSNAVSDVTGGQVNYLRKIATGAHIVKLGNKVSEAELKSIMKKMMADPNIEMVEPDTRMYPMFTPSDARYNEQWHYFESTGGLNLPDAWDTTTGTGVVVGVLDTGYRPHADLVGNLLPGYDFISSAQTAQDGNGRDSDARDEGDWTNDNECIPGRRGTNSSWHGTHVAGTIAAVANSTGVVGAAFGSKVVPIRVLGRCGGSTSDIADALIWGAGGNVPGVPANPNPAKVLNLSLGGGGACGSTMQSAINRARSLGATVVVAAGNSNADVVSGDPSRNIPPATPANCNGVVTVAATNRSGGRAFYSNFGSPVDVAAPGGETRVANDPNGVLSTLNAGRRDPGADSLAFYQGTSMATPHVAAAAALLYSVNPSITPTQVENILKNTARSFPRTCNGCGEGIVDAAAAVAAAGGGSNPTPTPAPNGSVLQDGVAKTSLSGARNSTTRFTFQVPAGASNLSFRMTGGSGDADLYVRFGSEPTTSTYDCRPFRNGNNETCSFSSFPAGTYHVMLVGYRNYSGVSLVASYD